MIVVVCNAEVVVCSAEVVVCSAEVVVCRAEVVVCSAEGIGRYSRSFCLDVLYDFFDIVSFSWRAVVPGFRREPMIGHFSSHFPCTDQWLKKYTTPQDLRVTRLVEITTQISKRI